MGTKGQCTFCGGIHHGDGPQTSDECEASSHSTLNALVGSGGIHREPLSEDVSFLYGKPVPDFGNDHPNEMNS